MNKKILLSFLLVVLIALSVSSVSAEDVSDVVAADDADTISESVDTDVLTATKQPESATYDAIQTVINGASDGDTIDLSNFAEYDITNNTIKVLDKDKR